MYAASDVVPSSITTAAKAGNENAQVIPYKEQKPNIENKISCS